MPGIFDTGIFDTGIFDTPLAGVNASASMTQAGSTVSSAGAVLVAGSASIAEGSDSASASGAVRVQGSVSATQGGDVLSATSGSGIIATAAITQGGNSVSATGAAQVNAALNVTLAADTLSAAGTVHVKAVLSASQAGDIVSASGAISTAGIASGTASLSQDAQTVSASAAVRVVGTVNLTQDGDTSSVPAEPFVVAPSYGAWARRPNKKKPRASQLPKPVQAGESVIDEAVLRQMEQERLAALVLQRKTEALERVDDLRTYAPAEKRPTRLVTIQPRRFDVVEVTPGIRTRVINLFRPPPPPPLKAPVPVTKTLNGLAPRKPPQPDIAKTRTISLRRSENRMTQTGLTQHG